MHTFDELAKALLGLTEADEPYDLGEVMFREYGLDLDQFNRLIGDLLPFCYPVESPEWEGAMRHTFGELSRDGQAWVPLAVLDMLTLRASA